MTGLIVRHWDRLMQFYFRELVITELVMAGSLLGE